MFSNFFGNKKKEEKSDFEIEETNDGILYCLIIIL